VYTHAHFWKGSSNGDFLEEFAKVVEDRTGGAVKMEFYWPGALPYKGYEMLEVVGDGLIDVGEVCPDYISGEFAVMLDVYSQFTTENNAESYIMMKEILTPAFTPIFTRYNAKVLIGMPAAIANQWFSRMPVTRMDHMKDVKARAYNSANAEKLAAYGCSPIVIPLTELYTALQRGVVDACSTSYTSANDVKFWEVIDYVTETRSLGGNIMTIQVNQDVWAAVPEDMQQIIHMTGLEYSDKGYKLAFGEYEQLRQNCIDRGMTILQLEPGEREKLIEVSGPPSWKKYLDEVGAEGIAIFKQMEYWFGRPYLSVVGY